MFDVHPKNPPNWDQRLCIIDQGIACNDDYLFKYNIHQNLSDDNEFKVLI